MRKLIESTHVTLGGEIGSPQEWAFPYLDDEHASYASGLLAEADALPLGRRTYEGLSAAYTTMTSTPFVDRMNSIPKYVASRTESRRGLTGSGRAGGSKHGRYLPELPNSPFRTPPRKACHSAGVNRRTGPAESLLLRTPIVPPGRLATSTQLPLA